MANALWIITGASKGLGKALAEEALRAGDAVAALSRTGLNPGVAAPVSRFRSWSGSVQDISRLPGWLEEVWVEFDPARHDSIHLVNNAAVLEPLGAAPTHSIEAIQSCVEINLTAPMVLCSTFLARLREHPGMKTITNVSSGVAERPIATWSAYSATKAGLRIYTHALAKETAEDPRTRCVSFSPGVMDTEMQALIRSQPADVFPEVERFRARKREGALLDPARVGAALFRLLADASRIDRVDYAIGELLSS